MIEIYLEIADSMAKVSALEWVDIAPRVEEHTNLYPGGYITIDEITPINAVGGSTLCDLRFTVEIWLKPYHSTTVKPLSPALGALRNNMDVVKQVREAISGLEGEWVRSTTLELETPEKLSDGFYKIVQHWVGTTAFEMKDGISITNPPELEFG